MQQVTQGSQAGLPRLAAGSSVPRAQSGARIAAQRPNSLPSAQGQKRPVPRAAKLDEVDTASSNGATANSTNPLDFDELTDLIRMVHDTDIVELELKSKKFSLAVRKKEALATPEPVYQQIPQAFLQQPSAMPSAPAPAASQAAPAAPSASTSAPAPPPAPAASGSDAGGVEVASPMSGTFYRSPAPGEAAFVQIGDRVEKGQTIGIIEAMKLMNEIEADASGTLVKFLVDNGSSVAPGQGLVLIKP